MLPRKIANASIPASSAATATIATIIEAATNPPTVGEKLATWAISIRGHSAAFNVYERGDQDVAAQIANVEYYREGISYEWLKRTLVRAVADAAVVPVIELFPKG
jgi:hypothetical protein